MIDTPSGPCRLGVFGEAYRGTTIHLGFQLDAFARDLHQLTTAFWIALPFAMVFVAGGAWLTARRGLAPVAKLSEAMEKLSPQELHRRLSTKDSDLEYHRIIEAYNAMLARLERSFAQANRFSADASHELKTPLAVMRGTVERALNESGDDESQQSTYAEMLDEVDHLQSIVEVLLLLARVDAGKLPLAEEELDFATWLDPLLEDASLMAEPRRITLHHERQSDVRISADPVLLYRALSNLFRNAIHYNHDDGEVWCSLVARDGEAIFTLTNTGTPIPTQERAQIFERFQRGSNVGGTGEGRGLGIGLSLAREIIIAHGGRLTLGECTDSTTSFVVALPAGVKGSV